MPNGELPKQPELELPLTPEQESRMLREFLDFCGEQLRRGKESITRISDFEGLFQTQQEIEALKGLSDDELRQRREARGDDFFEMWHLEKPRSRAEAERWEEEAGGRIAGFLRGLPQIREGERIIPPLTPEYFRRLSLEQREEYLWGTIAEIRRVLELLESTRERGWHMDGLTTEERTLNFLLTHILFSATREFPKKDTYDVGDTESWTTADIYERMDSEISGRQWLHINNLLIKRSSPSDIEALVRGIMELTDLKQIKWLVKIPGFGPAWRKLEEHGVELIRLEGQKERQEFVGEAREETVRSLMVGRPETERKWAAGLSKEAITELAERHLHVSGREGEWYRKYCQQYQVVKYGRTEKDDRKEFVATNPETGATEAANATFDPYRLLFYPHAIWQFFGVGGSPKGDPRTFTFLRRTVSGDFVKETIKMDAGMGLGREVRKILLEAGLDFSITDWLSRRMKHYIFGAWVEEQREKNTDLWQQWSRMEDEERKKVQHQAFTERFGLTVNPWEERPKAHETIEDLSNFKIEDVSWDYLQREKENVRAQVRDCATALSVLGKVWGFINKPTLENFFAVSGFGNYTSVSDAQAKGYRPLFEAIRHIYKGKILGYNLGPVGKSIAARVYPGWLTLSEAKLADVEEAAMAQGKLPVRRIDIPGTLKAVKEALMAGSEEKEKRWEEAEAKIKNAIYTFHYWFMENAFDLIDPELYVILLIAIVGGQLEQLQKELGS